MVRTAIGIQFADKYGGRILSQGSHDPLYHARVTTERLSRRCIVARDTYVLAQ